jgi:hypothetical protein
MVDPCWANYHQVGKKLKNGKEVPNCVPVSSTKDTATTKKSK